MSISTINNTTPGAVAWANLSANSLNCVSLTCANPVSAPIVAASIPVTGGDYAVGNADGDVTAAVAFNFAAAPGPFTFNTNPTLITSAPFDCINLVDTGYYNIIVDISKVTMTVAVDSYGPFIVLLKISTNAGVSFSEVAQSIEQGISNTVEGSFKVFSTLNITVPNTQLQVIFKRTDAATNPGDVSVPLTEGNGIRIVKLA